MFANYALIDPRDNQVFYVGLAEDVYARFIQHLRCDGSNPNKDARIQAMKAANVMVVMSTLQLHETIEQAKQREAYWIRHYYDLGMPLTNQLIPRYKEEAVEPVLEQDEPKLRLRPRMPLEEQREYVLSLLEQGMTRRKIYANVDGFIHPSVVDTVIAECIITQPVEPVEQSEPQEYVQTDTVISAVFKDEVTEPQDNSVIVLGKTPHGKRVQITKEQFEIAKQLRKSGKSTGYRDLKGFFDLSEHHAKALNSHLRREIEL
jgi:predicted GIY-YIG superfamily endonuclease